MGNTTHNLPLEITYLEIELEPDFTPPPVNDWLSLLGFYTICTHILICFVIKYFLDRLREQQREPAGFIKELRDLITDIAAISLAIMFVVSGLPEHPDQFEEWWNNAIPPGPRMLTMICGWAKRSAGLAFVSMAAVMHRLASPRARAWVRGAFPEVQALANRQQAGMMGGEGRRRRRRHWYQTQNL
jgi:hypothetical protein